MQVFWIVLITVITGQITRIGDIGLLTDIIIPIYLGAWLISRPKNTPFPQSSILWGGLLWIFYLLISLLLNIPNLIAPNAFIGSFAYWIRLLVYGLLLFPFSDYLIQDRSRTLKQMQMMILCTGGILTLLGYVQLILFPDFSFMAQFGWDPHQGRLLSTWYDPNFLGGFLAMVLTVSVSWILVQNQEKSFRTIIHDWRWWIMLVYTLCVFGALILTFSRSALLAFLAGIMVVTVLLSWRLMIIVIVLLSLTISINPRLQERIIGAFQIDVTASLRIQSWKETIIDIERAPIFGVGYNTLKYQKLVPDEVNSASGRDSSLLTLWLTSGFIGLLGFLGIIVSRMVRWILSYRTYTGIEKMMRVSALACFSSILVHSLFVNSIFFPHILIFLLMLLVI